MIRQDTETALMHFVFHILRNASELEARLTIFLLVYLGFCPEHWCFVFKEELLNGQDFFNDTGERIFQIYGCGITSGSLNEAIQQVNKRGLLKIKNREEGTLVVKLNIKYLKNEVSKYRAYQ
ncbi:MAG: hypothetical protein ABIE03_01850 [Patescibacteria group bacterium]